MIRITVFTYTWSVWLLVHPSGDFQVSLYVFLCGKYLFCYFIGVILHKISCCKPMQAPFACHWFEDFLFSYFDIKITHYNFKSCVGIHWYIWLSLLWKESWISLSFSFVGLCTEIIVKFLNFLLILREHNLSSTASKFIVALLYFLLIRRLVPKVLLSLLLYIIVKFLYLKLHAPSILSLRLLQYQLCCFLNYF